MTWLDDFEADLLRMVQRDKPHAVKITEWEEDEQSGGYCETCHYTETVVVVSFNCDECGTKDHFMSYSHHSWTWSGGLAELMRELVRE